MAARTASQQKGPDLAGALCTATGGGCRGGGLAVSAWKVLEQGQGLALGPGSLQSESSTWKGLRGSGDTGSTQCV